MNKRLIFNRIAKLRYAIGVLFVFTCLNSSRASIILVENTSNAGPGSLRAAIASATAFDTVLINIKGTIFLDSQLEIIGKSDLSIIGPYPKHSTISPNSGWTGSLLNIDGSSRILIQGIGFVGGYGTTRHATIQSCPDTIEFSACLFESSLLTAGNGGAILIDDATTKLTRCSFINNSGLEGGALYIGGISSSTIVNCTFSGNTAGSQAGAISIRNTSTVNLYYNTFVQNTSSSIPEAIRSTGGSFTYLENNAIGSNGTGQQVKLDGASTSYGGNQVKLNYSGEPTGIGIFLVSDLLSFSLNMGLRPTILEDGYGLKYWPIVEATSDLINPDSPSPRTPAFDCRNAPRSLLGTSIILAYPDAGAAEYTHLRVTNASGDKAVANSYLWTLEVAQRKDNVHFIEFDIPSPTDINPLTEGVLAIKAYFIDGFTQPGSAIPGPNQFGFSGLTPAILPIKLINTGVINDGIRFNSGTSGSKVLGISIQNFNNHGFELLASNIKIYGCEIGLDDTGAANGSKDSGVRSWYGNTVIGGWEHYQRNVISGNGQSGGTEEGNVIVVNGINVIIKGNIIGLDATGQLLLGTPDQTLWGIYVNAEYSKIGGSRINEGNIIGDNYVGIYLDLVGDFSTVQGNRIGVAWDGITAVGNSDAGILLSGADDALIGGYSTSTANKITNNGLGIAIIDNTTPGLGNLILGNSIYLNDNQGIDLGNNDSVVPNDGLVSSLQDNYGLDYPVLTAASNCDLIETVITYDLSVPTGSNYRVEFFTNTSPDLTNGEGETYLGFQVVSVTSNPQTFTYNVGILLTLGTSVTATVTSAVYSSTSEFGVNTPVYGGDNGTITYADICFGTVATPTVVGDLGGNFSFDGGDPADGSILDGSTGELSNGVEGTTYSIVYDFLDGCGNADTTTLTVTSIDESFVMADFCPGSGGTAVPSLPGGVFSLNPIPGDGATITSGSGILSGGVEGTTYTVQYIATDGTCSDTGFVTVNVISTDATFTMADFCPTVTSPAAIPVSPGGVFGFAPPPGDGASINTTTGAITGGVEGATYSIKYTVGPCLIDFTLAVNVSSTDESFSYADFCPGGLGTPFGIAEPGGIFYFEVDDDPAFINASTGAITNGVEGTTYSVIHQVGTCDDRDTVEVTVLTVSQEFTFTNFCVVADSSGTGPIAADPGIANYILLGPADGATINPTTGIIHYPTEGTTYTVVDSASTGTCWQADTVFVTAVEVNENFVIDDICFGETATPLVEAVLVDTFFFALDPDLFDPVLIDGYTGGVTLGLANTTYTVRRISYVGTCADSADATFTINQPNASFTFDNFCPADFSPAPIEEVSGGDYTLAFPGGFAETIDGSTGVIAGPQEDSTYSVIYTLLIDGCENSDTQLVHVINVPAEFEFEDFCWEAESAPGVPLMAGGIWDFGFPAPIDGAIITEGGVIVGATEGTTYMVEYTLTVDGCTQEDSMTVLAIGVDESFVFPSICVSIESDPPIPAAGGGDYHFIPLDPGDGATINTSTGAITNGVEGATYTVEYVVFDISGACSESSSISVEVIAIDESFSTSNFCAAFDSDLISPTMPGGSFSLAPDFGDGANIDPSTGIINNAVAGTIYSVEYSVSDGFCTDRDTNLIYARESDDPTFTLTNHCMNVEIEAEVIGTLGGTFDFQTPPGDAALIDPTTGLISNSTGNTYEVRYITTGGAEICVDTLVLLVEIFPEPVIITIASDILIYCPEVTLGPIHVSEQTDAFKIYWYEDDAAIIVIDSTFSFIPDVLSVGNNTFYAQAKSTKGCLGEIESYTVFLSDTSGMRAGEDISICLGSPAQLEAYGGVSYLWQTSIPIGDYTVKNPVAFSLNEEEYIVRITNVDNCHVYDTLSVGFNPLNLCEIDVFNAFSPNDDGTNDFWYIDNLINYLPNTVYIYNRWGDEILAIENYDNINVYWDGTDKNGQPLMPGTYFYVVITEFAAYNQASWVQIVR